MRTVLLLLCLVFTSPLCLGNEIYKTVDEDGKVTFTDAPRDSAEKVELEDTNSLPPPPHIPQRVKPATDTEANQDYVIYILSPEDGAQLGPTQKTLSVQVELNRSLDPQHYLQLFIGGEVKSPPGKNTTLVANMLKRGQNQVSVSVVDQTGNIISTSPTVIVHVIRPNPKST